MNLKHLLPSLMLLSASVTASAAIDLVDGGVYRIVCNWQKNGQTIAMQAPTTATNPIAMAQLDEDSPNQLWIAYRNESGTGYHLRTLTSGAYMTSPIQQSQNWTTTYTTTPDEGTMSFIFNEPATEVTIQAVGWSSSNLRDGFAHGNGGDGTRVICYGNGAESSKWTVTLVDISEGVVNFYKDGWAPLTIKPNRVYQFVNKLRGGSFHAVNGEGNVTCITPDATDKSQLWVAEPNPYDNTITLRNLVSGRYLSRVEGDNNAWNVIDRPLESALFEIEPEENAPEWFTIGLKGAAIADHKFAHQDQVDRLVGWTKEAAADASRWSVKMLTDYNPTALEAEKANWVELPVIRPVNGQLYRLTNVGYPVKSLSHANNGNAIGEATDANSLRQLWLAEVNEESSGFVLRNYDTGSALQSSMGRSVQWGVIPYLKLNESKTRMYTTVFGNGVAIQPLSVKDATGEAHTHGFAHIDGQNKVVGWETGANQTRWVLNLVNDYTEEQIEAQRQTWEFLTDTPVNGKLYRLTNVGYPGKSLSHDNSGNATGEATNANSLRQLWLAEVNEDGTGFVLRNYDTGSALQSSMATSGQWKVVNSSKLDGAKTLMYTETFPNGIAFQPLSVKDASGDAHNYGFAHINGSSYVVSWESGSNPTRWLLNLVDDYTDEQIEAQRQTWEWVKSDNMEDALGLIFADKACTELNGEYQAMSLDQVKASAPYRALPAPLQDMVAKIHSGDWSETDPTNAEIQWDSAHAKKFRVQMYEPYSSCNDAASLTCIQAYSNFNNPTGILTDNGTTLYVMVEKGAPEGSTLYLAPRVGDGNVNKLNEFTDGFELHEGLNIINCTQDCALMAVYYVVRTNEGRTRVRKLTDYDDIKIHIEGGSINGFYNSVGDELYTADTNEDWFYYRERARFPYFCLMSKHCLLYFHFFDIEGNNNACLKRLLSREEYQAGNFDLKATMDAWDDLFVAEMLVMGLMDDNVIRAEKEAGRDWYDPLTGDDVAPSDYALYFNNRLMGISSTSGFMSATWYRTTYNISTLRSVVMQFPTMDLWGPAHEFGHLNQGPMKIAGTSEESNNVFSNVALFTRGDRTSRANLPSSQRENFYNGYNFHQHGTWGTTRMWFQLWLYYHAAGHNKKFYPRLYELLREDPLKKNSTEHLLAKDDLLHFAKQCCIAAGEDLTDFFEAWGFFTVQDGYYIGDYTSYTSYLSEEDVAEWKAEIKQMAEENGWEKNTAIIFIDDRVGSSKPAYADWCSPADAGEMGGLQDFIDGNDQVTGEYEFVLTGTTVTVSGGEGGVGFLIYDENGKLIGFSNDKTFTVSSEVAQKIASGEVTFSVVDSHNEEVKVIDTVHEGDFNTRIEVLADLLEQAEELLAYSDPTRTKVGYLKPETVADLMSAYTEAKEKSEAGEINEDNITELYDKLNKAALAVPVLNPTADQIINVVPNGIYAFTVNRKKGLYGVRPNGNNNDHVAPVSVVENVNKNAEYQQWYFIPAAEEGSYYIQSVSTLKYLKLPDADNTALKLTDEPEQSWTVKPQVVKYVSVTANTTEDHNSVHADDNTRIVRWEAGAAASQWTLELIDNWETKANLIDLSDIINKSEVLLAKAGTVNSAVETEPIALSGSDLFTNAPCKVDNADKFSAETWSYLFDDNTATRFQSDYSAEGTTDGLNHYIQIEIPESARPFNQFTLSYRTREAAAPGFNPIEGAWYRLLNSINSGDRAGSYLGYYPETEWYVYNKDSGSRQNLGTNPFVCAGNLAEGDGVTEAQIDGQLWQFVAGTGENAGKYCLVNKAYPNGAISNVIVDNNNNLVTTSNYASNYSRWRYVADRTATPDEVCWFACAQDNSGNVQFELVNPLNSDAKYLALAAGGQKCQIMRWNVDEASTWWEALTDAVEAVRNTPQSVALTWSADGETWTELTSVTSGLTTEFGTDQNLPVCELPADAKYIRFMVNGVTPEAEAAGHPYFAISELRLSKSYNVASGATPDEKFTFVEPEMMMDVYNDLETAKLTLENPYATNEQRTEAKEKLTESYTILRDAMNRNIERLRELIEATRELAEQLGSNHETATPLSTSAEQYSTNAEYVGTNEGDHLGTWEAMYDNQSNTYFHSTYDSNSSDGGDHYIQIDLLNATTAEQTDLLLTYRTRDSQYTYAPAEAVVQYSTDGETWTTVHELDAQLPLTRNTDFVSETFSVPAGTRYVRFTVKKNQANDTDTRRGTSNGHDYFAVSEFVLCEYAVESEPYVESYPDSNAAALSAALRQVHNSEVIANAPRADYSHYDNSYAALLPHYQTLLAIKNNPTSTEIEEIEADGEEAGETVIYNLRGMRISRISTPGVYIVNGKKVVVK